MRRPIIGIPPCVDLRERWRPGRTYLYIDHAYAAAVDAAGGLALHLPLQSDATALIDILDGLMLPGGDDFLPDGPLPDGVEFEPASSEQIEFDRALLTRAMELGIPTLGICYGAQLIAIEHGGRLHYDLPTDQPGSLDHVLPGEAERHSVTIEAGSRLARALGAVHTSVNSLHHQGIRDLGRGLNATAHAQDGLIEGFEATGETFVIGVQWHPEKMLDDSSSNLFQAFVDACRQGMRT